MKEIEKITEQSIAESQKSKFLGELSDLMGDDMFPAEWDDAKKQKALSITNDINPRKAMMAAIPIQCRDTCEYRHTCPLFAERMHPVGKPCPIETKYVVDNINGLVESLEVDETNWTEVTLVRDMVNQEVQIMRSIKLLAQESFIQENVIGVDTDGDAIMQKQLHLATTLQEKLYKQRDKNLSHFIASRGDKAKTGLIAVDTAESLSKYMASYNRIQRAKGEALKAELGMKDSEDDIIDAEIIE